MRKSINFNEKLSEEVKDKIFYAIDKVANGITLSDLNLYGKNINEYMKSPTIQINQKVLSFIVYWILKNKKFILSDKQIAAYLNTIGCTCFDEITGEVKTDKEYYKAKTINAAIQTILAQGLITIEHSPYKKLDMMNPNAWKRREIKVNVKEVIKLYLTINFNEMYKPKSFKKTAVKKRLWNVRTNKSPRTIAELWKLIVSVHKASYKTYVEALSNYDNDFCINYLNHESKYFKTIENPLEELSKRSIENLIKKAQELDNKELSEAHKNKLNEIYNIIP